MNVEHVDQAVEAPVTPETPVVPLPVTEDTSKAPKAGDDLRQVQNLLVTGTFPGAMAPSIVKAYQLLGALADRVDQDASNGQK